VLEAAAPLPPPGEADTTPRKAGKGVDQMMPQYSPGQLAPAGPEEEDEGALEEGGPGSLEELEGETDGGGRSHGGWHPVGRIHQQHEEPEREEKRYQKQQQQQQQHEQPGDVVMEFLTRGPGRRQGHKREAEVAAGESKRMPASSSRAPGRRVMM
jgi:hypothetical protein